MCVQAQISEQTWSRLSPLPHVGLELSPSAWREVHLLGESPHRVWTHCRPRAKVSGEACGGRTELPTLAKGRHGESCVLVFSRSRWGQCQSETNSAAAGLRSPPPRLPSEFYATPALRGLSPQHRKTNRDPYAAPAAGLCCTAHPATDLTRSP